MQFGTCVWKPRFCCHVRHRDAKHALFKFKPNSSKQFIAMGCCGAAADSWTLFVTNLHSLQLFRTTFCSSAGLGFCHVDVAQLLWLVEARLSVSPLGRQWASRGSRSLQLLSSRPSQARWGRRRFAELFPQDEQAGLLSARRGPTRESHRRRSVDSEVVP